MKRVKARANFETDALNLAMYVSTNFKSTTEGKIDLKAKTVVGRNIQKYLDLNSSRRSENELLGIIAVRDYWKHSTGGRIHLFVGMRGPLAECFEPKVIEEPTDYELKHKYFLKAVSSASKTKPAWYGNIHFHPRLCNFEMFLPATLLHFIRQEHGYQNEVQQLADSTLHLLMPFAGKPFWRPANSEILNRLFSQLAYA